MILSFAGCGERNQKEVTETSKPSSSLTAADFVKASTQRPAAIPAAIDTTAGCQVDWVDDKSATKAVTIRDKTKVRMVGWAGDIVRGKSSREVYIVLYGPQKVYFKALANFKRTDVFMAFKKPGLENCGWEASVDLSGVPAGTYYIKVIQIDGRFVSGCDTQRTIVLK